ncbi:prepilin peptidase [Secundilactobacillus hailunensis]|uniref:Prepilin peptidase n=1 Tax=Secundilactobacillus hailunensis TaxID=2559923 RepID=A0ABW1TB83_9LACO|nr:A24 family peptidase [Secundilactobacillus hailunensis]
MLLIQFIVGTILGSFLFASYSRLTSGGSLWHPARSECDYCVATIRWFDLAPIVSYLNLRGRCRSCGHQISPATICCELFLGGLVSCWQPTIIDTCYLLVGTLLFFMAVADAARLEFSAIYSYCMMACSALVYIFYQPHHLLFTCLIFIWLLSQFFDPHLSWIGSGDLDAFLCLLLLLGLTPFAWLLLLSSVFGLIASQTLHLTRLPFMPFIAISYLLIFFFI